MLRWCVIILVCAALVQSTSINEPDAFDYDIDIDAVTGPTDAPIEPDTVPTQTSIPTTTTDPPIQGDDLYLVDKIIIGVTVALAVGIVIGGIVMFCLNKKKAKKAKKTKDAKQRMINVQRQQWDNTAMVDDGKL